MTKLLYTVKEVSEIIKCNTSSTYKLIKKGLLPALKLGQLKVRHVTLVNFLEKYEGKDLTDLDNIIELDIHKEVG
ncbi:helix-turn-helix domain-containing protein [Clostridium sp. 'deep sea']|uniref:helix-turn-helix domain-containing protein n=1 Tax=Clostridium sp. 'deep sea' TaxID=2779445 RepID=UPI0018966090|nr:helix-turn-helix domain-containing protein [Clostridium sp. 'deep sea']QOR34416.1 helix-turn-helix domain-containing protein [Clostridium sp. 'deep sea']